ncbi:hypothetical protein [Novosphingobium sp. P6W]|nr:hypothetical protein [Novosphingobium sp. P6W]
MSAKYAGASLIAMILMTPAAHAAARETTNEYHFDIASQPLDRALTDFGR